MNLTPRITCPICNSENRFVLMSRKFSDPTIWRFIESHYQGKVAIQLLADENFEVSKCRDCAFLWQSQILQPALMDKLYSEWVPADNSLSKKVHSDSAFFQGYAREMLTISSLISKKPFETHVLDFGMGWGFWCLMAKAHGYNVTGLETSGPRLAYGLANGIKVADSITALNGAQFDFINSDQVLEHVPDPVETLRALSDLLIAGGYARISVPNGRGIEYGLKSPQWKAGKTAIHPLEHINCFTGSTLKRLGQEAGLKAVSLPYTGLKSMVGSWGQPTRVLFQKVRR